MERLSNKEEGTPEKEFLFWSKRFAEQVQYVSDLMDRFKRGEMTAERFQEVGVSALERLRYISQQRLWIIEEIQKPK